LKNENGKENMLTVWEAIKQRRSIRRFVLDDVTNAIIEQILEAARLAPSAHNYQPWRFLVVRDKEAKKELRRICLGQRHVEEVPVVIVCFSDLDSYSEEARKKRRKEKFDSGIITTLSGRFADPEFLKYLDLVARPVDQVYMEVIANTYIAIEHLVLMATALGLGTCWVGAFTDALEINHLFGLTDNLIPLAVISVGYMAGEIPPQRPRLSREEIVLKPKVRSIDSKA